MKRTLLPAVLLFFAFGGLMAFPKEAASAVTESLRLCAGIIIPALFPFLVLSSLMVKLGFASLLGQALAPALRPLLGISPAGVGALTLGLMGGYPVGAKTVRQLWESGQCGKEESERLLCFCNNCGAAFFLGVAGSQVFGNVKIGVLLWAAHVLGALTVGVLTKGRDMGEAEGLPVREQCPVQCVSLATALTESVQTSLNAVLNICGYVVLFGVLVRLFTVVGMLRLAEKLPNGTALLTGIFEVSGGVSMIQPNQIGSAALASFLLGFGGLSVWCQTLAMLEGSGLDVRPALFGKLLHGGVAALWASFLLMLFPSASEAAAVQAFPVLKRRIFSLPLWVTLICWGIFFLWLWYFVRLDHRKIKEPRV